MHIKVAFQRRAIGISLKTYLIHSSEENILYCWSPTNDMRLEPIFAARRVAVSLLAVSLSFFSDTGGSGAFEVPSRMRSEQEQLSNKLYSSQVPQVVPYQQQVSEAITIQSMRGIWSLQETIGGQRTIGRLIFRGAEFEERGTVSYDGSAGAGRGPWIIKADGFGRSPRGVGGAIERKALWKLRRGSLGTYTYAGRVNVLRYLADGMPDAYIEGDIIELIKGGKPKGGSERKAGSFRAVLERRLTNAEEEASTDSAAAGGQPEALNMMTVMQDQLVYKHYQQ